MKPALAVAALAAALAAVATLARPPPPEVHASRQAPASSTSARRPGAPCPPDFLPDDGVCVPAAAPAGALTRGAVIPKLPGRDAAFSAYVLPVPGEAVGDVTPGSLGDGGTSSTGILIRVAQRTKVTVVTLAGQQGAARVISSANGVLVTAHSVSVDGRARAYLVVEDPVGTARARGEELPAGTGLAELEAGLSLHLDTRRVLPGVDVSALSPDQVFSDAVATSEDPRNVLSTKR